MELRKNSLLFILLKTFRFTIHHQIYSPLWASASLTIFFQDSSATVHQFLKFNFLRSSSTPSFHRSLGRPTLLRPSGSLSIVLLGISLSLILWRCPAHRRLVILIPLVISWYNSRFYLIRHSPLSHTGPYIFRNTFLSKVLNASSSALLKVHVLQLVHEIK
jgi:hypothetical protein